MQIEQIADLIDVEISLTYFPNQDGRWCARFDGGNVRDGGTLIGTHGNAKTPDAAISDYCRQVAGRPMYFYVGDNQSKEFKMPADLGHSRKEPA